MNKWDFITVIVDANGQPQLSKLSPQQLARVEKYTKALEVAASSVVANPPFSNYFVKESIGLAGKEGLPAGNLEYGLCQALHGEETALAAFRSRYGGNKTGNLILGIIAGEPGNIASPCGNCRDIMLQNLGTDFEIVSGASSGGVAVVTGMQSYLFDSFVALNPAQDVAPWLNEEIVATVTQGSKLINDAYSPPLVHPERRYHALIVTKTNRYFGARDIMSDYHPIYALRDAVRQSRRAQDSFIDHVVIVCEDFGGDAPQVMYKDRQHLLELNLQAELLSQKDQDPTVYLVTHRKKRITGLWKTSIKEWLPLAFTPRNFGPEFINFLTKYFQEQRS